MKKTISKRVSGRGLQRNNEPAFIASSLVVTTHSTSPLHRSLLQRAALHRFTVRCYNAQHFTTSSLVVTARISGRGRCSQLVLHSPAKQARHESRMIRSSGSMSTVFCGVLPSAASTAQ